MGIPVPPALRRVASDEYAPLPWRRSDREALTRLETAVPDTAARLGMGVAAYLADRRGTAATLRAINAAAGETFYDVPAEAETDTAAAEAVFGGGVPVIDVQSHLVNPGRMAAGAADRLTAFLERTVPERWGKGVDPAALSARSWLSQVFGGSETAVALITCFAGREHEQPLTNEEVHATAELVDRYAGTGRVLTHSIVHPNLGEVELERMVDLRERLAPSGWKVYTLWQPPEWTGPGEVPRGWFLDDDVGMRFLEQVRAVGPGIVCAHKGIAGAVTTGSPAGSSPRDIGPAAAAFPDLGFVVYHSGYEIDPRSEEGAQPDTGPHRGVGRLVASLQESGVPAGANVHAELGTTWYLMLRRPVEAAHVLGKLLSAVGPGRILWGTDSVWYGPPQFLIDSLRAFVIPPRMQEEHGYPLLTPEVKDRILGGNAAALYGIDVAALGERVDADDMAWLEPASRAALDLFDG